MKRTSTLLLIIALIITVFNSCGTTTVKNEEEIKSDLSTNKYILSNYSGYTVENVSVVKRQTDIDEKTDVVYVEAMLLYENETGKIEGNIDLILQYGLYDNGWILDKCEIDNNGTHNGGSFIPLTGYELDDVALEKELRANYGDAVTDYSLSNRETDLTGGTDVYYIKLENQYKYCHETLDVAIICSFDVDTGVWRIIDCSGDVVSSEWNLKGEYYYKAWDGDDGIEEYTFYYDTPTIVLEKGNLYDAGGLFISSWEEDMKTTPVREIDLEDFICENHPYLDYEAERGYRFSLSQFMYYDFDYIALIEHDKILLIGKDAIAMVHDYEDKYNYSIELIVSELHKK